jgi:hypothetical protein
LSSALEIAGIPLGKKYGIVAKDIECIRMIELEKNDKSGKYARIES